MFLKPIPNVIQNLQEICKITKPKPPSTPKIENSNPDPKPLGFFVCAFVCLHLVKPALSSKFVLCLPPWSRFSSSLACKDRGSARSWTNGPAPGGADKSSSSTRPVCRWASGRIAEWPDSLACFWARAPHQICLSSTGLDAGRTL